MTTPRPFSALRLHRLPCRLYQCGCSLLFLLVFALPASADQQAELKQLQKNIQTLQKELKEIQGNRTALQKALQQSESEMGQLQQKIDRIRKEMEAQNRELENLQQQRESLEEAHRQQQTDIGEQLRIAWRTGEQSALRLLLNQESPEDVVRLMGYHERVFAAHQRKLEDYLNTLEQLEQIEPQILDQQAMLQKNAGQLEQQAKQLRQQQVRRERTLASINSSIKDRDSELKQMEEERKRLQRLIEEVARTASALSAPTSGEAFSKRQGRMPWPAKGQLTTRFGATRPDSPIQSNGIVISASAGQPVIAVHQGRVVFADYFRGHGLLVIVDHGEGYLTLYAHNQSIARNTGDWVNAGDVIARVGNSGGRDTNALYFEIRQQGKPVNPINWLARV